MNRSKPISPSSIDYLTLTLSKTDLTDGEIARAISFIEDELISREEFILATGSKSEHSAFVIGVTGSPGAGKSSFLNAILPQLNDKYGRLAILAIDPSSHLNGGAILGDRIRISECNFENTLFFRSLATRGAFGGLSEVAPTIVEFLSRCGFRTIIIETVGVGQNEVEIVNVANVVVHVIDSSVGDQVQLEKSGIMEIGDIYFVNKSDMQESALFEFILKTSLRAEIRKNGMPPTVISGSSKTNDGILEVASKIFEHDIHKNQPKFNRLKK